MSTRALSKSLSRDAPGLARRLVIAMLLGVLVYRAAMFAAVGVGAIRYPYELDYGEGIVWQQMRWIFTDLAYGPIDQFPAIVFHYPPLYHAVTSIAASVLGTDELATGRSISLLSTIVAAGASATLVRLLLEGRASNPMQRLCAAVGALLVFAYFPVVHWAPLMRVDMLAMALSLLGLVAVFKALERERLIYLASALFVAAVYTKQISIAAPAASFLVLLAVRPRLALRGIATCIAIGLAALLALGWITDGGFSRHIFLYNVNRPDFGRLVWIFYVVALVSIYVGVAGIVLAQRLADLRSRLRVSGRSLRESLAADRADMRLLIAIAYLALTTLMLALVLKSGSSINYFLEWFFALGLFAAMGPAIGNGASSGASSARPVLAIGIPVALALQAWGSPAAPFRDDARSRAPGSALLSDQIAAADKPVISDDMVLLLRSGQDVLWEPAIFAELASTGVWDERPFVARIRNREFAFFVTWGTRGHHRFDERYNPAVADAIDDSYPVTEEIGGLTVHRPAAATR